MKNDVFPEPHLSREDLEGEERPLAVIMLRYPKLRYVEGFGAKIDGWIEDPEKALGYAIQSEREGWPQVSEKVTVEQARAAFAETPIGRALLTR